MRGSGVRCGALAVAVLAALALGRIPVAAQTVPVTFTVTSAADDSGSCASTCTLREAIAAANGTTGGARIVFDVAPGGPITITVGQGSGIGLPEITASDVAIDGTTQPGGGAHGVRIDDPNSSDGMSGVVFDGQRDSLRGFSITRFKAWGVLIRGSATGDVVAGNWIGTADGTTALGTANAGVQIVGGGSNTIGGAGSGDGNVVVGSTGSDGIALLDSSNNTIAGNVVGLGADGATRLPNAAQGVEIDGDSTGNHVGGTTAAARNVISGNGGIGVQLLGVLNGDGTCRAPANNVVSGNWIGLTASGGMPNPYGNQGEGVQVEVCAHDNLIGGTASGAGNVISGNHDDAIQIDDVGSPVGWVCNTTVQGNLIGTDPSGLHNIQNWDAGVKIQNGACNTLVGGTAAGARNVIGGNDSDGVYVLHAGTTGTQVIDDYIGVGADGSTPVPNQRYGVRVYGSAPAVTVSGDVISSNVVAGVSIENPGTDGTVISGSLIGLDAGGTLARGNGGNGVWIQGGPERVTLQNDRIENNAGAGVAVDPAGVTSAPTDRDSVSGGTLRDNTGLGIDLLPAPGVNANDGNNSNTAVGDDGQDFPVITAATAAAVAGTATPGTTVEVYSVAAQSGIANGGAAASLGTVVASPSGQWCLGGLSNLSGAVTATATSASGNTSELAANVAIGTGTAPCGGSGTPSPTPSPSPSPTPSPGPSPTASPGPTPTPTAPPSPTPTPASSPTPGSTPSPSDTTLFSDTFTEPNGAPQGWAASGSAAGASSGAAVSNDQLRITVALTAAQAGTFQYVQVHETSVQPSWASGTVLVDWQMASSVAADQTESLTIVPSAVTTDAEAQSNLIGVRVAGGTLSLVTRVKGVDSTLWSGPITADGTLHDFELRLDATGATLYEGTAGSAMLRTGPDGVHLAFSSGWPYLHASTDSTTPWQPLFDDVSIHLRSS